MGIWATSCTLPILLPFDDGVEEGGPLIFGFHPPTMELLKQKICRRMGTVGNLLVPGGNSTLTMRAGEEGALSFWPHSPRVEVPSHGAGVGRHVMSGLLLKHTDSFTVLLRFTFP